MGEDSDDGAPVLVSTSHNGDSGDKLPPVGSEAEEEGIAVAEVSGGGGNARPFDCSGFTAQVSSRCVLSRTGTPKNFKFIAVKKRKSAPRACVRQRTLMS